jgi:hypothetical protein
VARGAPAAQTPIDVLTRFHRIHPRQRALAHGARHPVV